MRKILGFIFFVFSGLIIAGFVYLNIESIKDIIDSEDPVSFAALILLWILFSDHFYYAVIINLLSLIAMADFHKSSEQ